MGTVAHLRPELADRHWVWKSLLSATTAVALAVTLAAGVQTSRADFRDRTSNTGSLFAAGTVEVGSESARLLIDVVGLEPTMTVQDCVEVRYTGSTLPVGIGLFTAPAGLGGLEPYLLVEVEEGTGAGDGTCVDFVSEGRVFDGTAQELLNDHRDGATALGDWIAVEADETRSYRVTVRVADDDAAQGLGTRFEVLVEARPVESS